MAKAGAHRMSVDFSEGAYETLEALAREQGKTKAEVLRDAIALESWFDEARREGARILIERPGGDLRELIPR